MKFKLLNVSVRGKRHIREDKPNQDYGGVSFHKKCLVAVLCDGLGSKTHSHIGSKTLVENALNLAQNFDFKESNLDEFGRILYENWQKEILTNYDDLANFSTTCLIVIFTKSHTFLGRAGDGMIAIFNENYKCVKEISEEKSDFANLTSSFGGRFEWSVLKSGEIYAICLCTDGILEFLKENKELGFFKEFILYYENKGDEICENETKEMLEKFNEKGFGDDKSLIVLWKKPNLFKKIRYFLRVFND